MSQKFQPPKGTRDFLPEEMRIRRAVFDRLRRYFELYGFEELDTPVFEHLEVLTLKSGPAAEKEIYAFNDKAWALIQGPTGSWPALGFRTSLIFPRAKADGDQDPQSRLVRVRGSGTVTASLPDERPLSTKR